MTQNEFFIIWCTIPAVIAAGAWILVLLTSSKPQESTEVFDITKVYTKKIKNDRDNPSILGHASLELDELDSEIAKDIWNEPPGEDGILGESVDVILCMMDLIHRNYPDISKKEFEKIVKKKLDKWHDKYHIAETNKDN